jgi:hypothetical protein
MRHFEYTVIDTDKDIQARLNKLGAESWQVVGVTTKKQLLIAPPLRDHPDARTGSSSC